MAGVIEELLGMVASGRALQAGRTRTPGWGEGRMRALQMRTQSGTSGGRTTLVCERQEGGSS